MDKLTLRKEFRKKRDSVDRNILKKASMKIFEKLINDENIKKSKVIMTYVSMGSEVDTHCLIENLLSQGKKVAVPVVNGKTLDISYINSMDNLICGSFGILEPKKSEFRKCEPSEIDVVIVPAVAFDETGHRIGYGAGFYDRLLPQINGVKIGICYDFCMVDNVFSETHDVKVDYIIKSA